MSILKQMSSIVDTDAADNPAAPLGTLASGVTLLNKALQSLPEFAETVQMLSAISGDEQGSAGEKFNGTVDFMGTPVEVKDGEADDGEGNKVYISPDGGVVADAKGRVMGRVENGKFVILDKNQASQLEKNKMAERSKL
jgi:hypothetical protein